MISSWLVFVVCIQLVWTCVPVRPGEDMPCPAKPEAAAAPDLYISKAGLGKPAMENGAMVYSCTLPEVLVEVVGTAGKEIPGGKLICTPNSGLFTLNGADVGKKQFVCGKAFNCASCTTAIKAAYSGKDVNEADLMPDTTVARPYCELHCPQNFRIALSGTRQEMSSAFCDANTDRVTALTPKGQEVSKTNKFDCLQCYCRINILHNGDEGGLCASGKLCVRPLPITDEVDICEAKCPPRSRAIYKDKMGTLHTTTILQCDMDDYWISQEVEQGGKGKVTCEYEANEGYSTTPPADAVQCPTLALLNCGVRACDSSQLIYISNGEKGAYVMCKKGALVTNQANMVLLTAQCLTDWNGVTDANCVTDESAVKTCLDMLSPTTRSKVTFSCDYGMCYLSCMNNAVFKYDIFVSPGTEVRMNQHLKCYQQQIRSVETTPVQNPMLVECV